MILMHSKFMYCVILLQVNTNDTRENIIYALLINPE